MSGGAQCRMEIGSMTVPLHQLVRGAPDVSFKRQFRSNQVKQAGECEFYIQIRDREIRQTD
jgi:hypothetical protein